MEIRSEKKMCNHAGSCDMGSQKSKMKLIWKSVQECHRNYIGQEVNQYNDEYDEIYEIFQAEGPECDCEQGKMTLMKVSIINPKTQEIEEIPDIDSFCDHCGVDDSGFFTENENNEIEF